MNQENELEPVNDEELSDAKLEDETVVDGEDVEHASVNDRGATFVTETTGPVGPGDVESVNDRAATGTADSEEEEEEEAEPESTESGEADFVLSPTFGDTTPKGETSNKKGVAEQFNASGDRFASTEAPFTSVEAPMDIYPKDGREFSDEPLPSSINPNFTDGPITSRDREALLRASLFDVGAVSRAMKVLQSNPIHTPDGPETADGRKLQPQSRRVGRFGNERVAVAAREFDTNGVRGAVQPSSDAEGQEEAVDAVSRLRQNAIERDEFDIEFDK